MAFKGPSKRLNLFETEEQEAARLAQAPVGSISHTLSLLPVRINRIENHQLIELPVVPELVDAPTCTSTVFGLAHDCDPGSRHRIVVIPIEDRDAGAGNGEPFPRKRDHAWQCRVMASDHPSYVVGGYDLSLSEAELRRGKLIEI